MAEWQLSKRTRVQGVEVAYEVMGDGPPVLLVHGFPSNSCIWREVAPVLARTHRVHVYDLPGQGASERRDGMDVSDGFQSRVLRDLVEGWGLERPAAVLHDIGCTYGMSAYYFERCRFERVALVSAAMMLPCVSAATQHAQKHLEAYRTMPTGLYELIARARIQSTTYKPLAPEALQAYLAPWLGREGQALWYNRVAQISDAPIRRLEAALGPLDIPVRIIWGTEDSWIPVDQAQRLQRYITNAELRLVKEGGHFLMEDAPQEVASLLSEFLCARPA
jgi:pimeloyl-ACP methyl ester carboxylesterase